MAETSIIPTRFRGPPESANGGWTCGLLAKHLDGPAQVVLRAPPPLDTEMALAAGDERVVLRHGETLIGEATPHREAIASSEAVDWDEATDAVARFIWSEEHPYPGCFVCGPDRGDGGLRLFPGPVEGRRVAATPFVPPADLCEGGVARPELVWAALDCPSWFGFASFHDDFGLVLLGRLRAAVHRAPREKERCVVTGFPIDRDGRKIRCGSSIFSADGELLATAEALWIELQEK